MNVAIWLLTALLALPLAEIVVFVLVAVWIGFAWAALALFTTTLAGALILRHSGGAHIARVRTVLGPQRVTALEADGPGTLTLLAGILLLIPGFITDAIGILLLVPPLRRGLGVLLLRAFTSAAPKREGVVDLDPQEWRQMPDAKLRDERDRQRGPSTEP
jgi:UPF0716 protein FxsA